mgnify:CR=1 FL=1
MKILYEDEQKLVAEEQPSLWKKKNLLLLLLFLGIILFLFLVRSDISNPVRKYLWLVFLITISISTIFTYFSYKRIKFTLIADKIANRVTLQKAGEEPLVFDLDTITAISMKFGKTQMHYSLFPVGLGANSKTTQSIKIIFHLKTRDWVIHPKDEFTANLYKELCQKLAAFLPVSFQQIHQ